MKIETEAEFRRVLVRTLDLIESGATGFEARDNITSMQEYIADNGAGDHRKWCPKCGGKMEDRDGTWSCPVDRETVSKW